MLAYSQTVSGAGSCCGVAPLVLSRRSFRNNPRYAHLLRRGVLFSVLASSRLSASPLPSFCRCPSALGRCPRVFLLSQTVLTDFHALEGLLTVCAFQILRLVPLGGLSCPRLLFVPFCPVSVAVGAWVCWSVAVRLSVGVCSVRLFPLHSFRRSDLLRLGAFVRLPLGFGGLLLAVPRSPFSTVLRLFVPFVRSRFNLPFTLAVGIGSTLYCGSCPQCWRFMLCRSDGSPTFAVVGRLSSNYSFSLPI